MSPECVYCGGDAGEFDEHEACVEASLEAALDEGAAARPLAGVAWWPLWPGMDARRPMLRVSPAELEERFPFVAWREPAEVEGGWACRVCRARLGRDRPPLRSRRGALEHVRRHFIRSPA